MGTYTLMAVSLKLKSDTPEKVLRALKWLANIEDRTEAFTELPLELRSPDSDPFWTLKRFHQLGRDYESNGSVDRFGNSTVNTWVTDPDGTISLYLYSSCKNYDLQLEGFLYMVAQYVSLDSPKVAGVLKSECDYRAAPITWDGVRFNIDYSKAYDQGIWN